MNSQWSQIITKILNKRILFILIIILIISIYFINFFLGKTKKKSKAANESVEITFTPTTLNGKANDILPELKIMGKPSVDIAVRGYELMLVFNKDHLSVEEINYPSTCSSVNGYSTTADLANQTGSIRIACANTTTSGFVLPASSPQEITRIIFRSKNSNNSTITINPSTIGFSMINYSGGLTTIRASNQQNITASVRTGEATESPTNTPTPTPTTATRPNATNTPTPTPTSTNTLNQQPESTNITLNLSLKFQGIINCPEGNKQIQAKIKLGGRTQTDYQIGTFSCQNGKWRGSVSFNVPPGDGYYLLIKGEKHIQKKICELNYNEPIGAEGSYRCVQGQSLNLVQGDNNLDLSGLTLLAGDLPAQDGVVNSYDTSLVRNNLGKKDEEALSLADINLDGIVNTQDHSLIIYALSVRVDEE